MIVRISNEGQYEVPESVRDELAELDHAAVAACESHDEKHFREVYGRLLEFVRSRGSRLGDDDLCGSELILPPPDVTIEEAAREFSGEGLLPG